MGCATWREGRDGFRSCVTGPGLFRWTDSLVERLDRYPDLRVVIHSTWRDLFDYEHLLAMLPSRISERVTGVTPHFRGREESIIEYRIDHGIVDYVIIDDDRRAFDREIDRVVFTHPDRGLGDSDALDRLDAMLDRFVAHASGNVRIRKI
jgi:hypothetical protein